ncbi:hypothetical protein T484DRAFT_1806871 [Baffinella frigidus]|nr:hypothetical protein T484DRAFT_1806871 [Cryptophyta sp. CCMP2293]
MEQTWLVQACKSSLLAALVVEAPVTGGAVELRGTRVAYLPQVPWVKNGTVLENILLHAPLDQEKLDQVIHDTGLDQDLAIWNKGVDTVETNRYGHPG